VVGPLPPPVMGPAVGTEVISAAFRTAGVSVVHVNTQDRRTVFNVGVLDARNVSLALVHAAQTGWRALRHSVALVYVPISQNRWGYARDAALILIARALRKPVVVHLRGANLQQFFHTSSRPERVLIRSTLRRVALAIALTPSLSDVFDGLVPPDRVRVLENAIPDPWPTGIEYVQRSREERASGGPLRLLFVANDFAAKGAYTAVAALTPEAMRRAELVVVGDPPIDVRRQLEAYAEEEGVRDRVRLRGGLVGDDKFREYAAADVFVYPSRNDGQPLVILEAMAAGLPIVTTTQGGIPDTVRDTAIVIERDDRPAFIEAVAALAADVDRRRKLGAAARQRFVAHYTPQHFQRRFEAVFADILAGVN
jgi:glycosyltransferase involved in cell wall biosynthesis